METIVFWVSIGLLLLFLIVGLICGLVRGLKRSSLHLLFFLVSALVAFFITKPITNAVLKIQIPMEGSYQTVSEFIISMIQEQFDLSNFNTAQAFIEKLPNAIVSPIIFMITLYLCYFVFDIIYLIVARLSFGKKKEDLKKHKPFRAYGAVVGVMEGFLLLFLTFAPITSLTQTYAEIASVSTTTSAQAITDQTTEKPKTVAEMLQEFISPEVSEILTAYNNSVVGKIVSAGGLDDAIFDGLSNFKLDGEKIEFRKEIVAMADIYDQVVVTVNNISDKNYKNLDFETLKKSLEKFMEQGLFKKVVADTLNDVVVHFEELKQSMNFGEIPEIIQELINDLQTVFTADNFNTYNYIKDDILKVLDIVEALYKNNLIEKFTSGTDLSIIDYLQVVKENKTEIETIASQAFSLNLVKDTFETLGQFANTQLQEMFKNDQGIEIALNLKVEEIDATLEDLMMVVDKFFELNDLVDITSILESDNFMSSIINLNNLDTALTKVGEVLDEIRNINILILPVESGIRDEKVYVFDNMLETFGIKLLGDEVLKNDNDTSLTKLNNYTDFINFVKPSLIAVKDLGLAEINEEESNFDTVLNKLIAKLKTDEQMLSNALLPLYQLNESTITLNETSSTIKQLIFDEIMTLLSGEATNNILDIEAVKAEAKDGQPDYDKLSAIAVWRRELNSLSQVLTSLDNSEDLQEGEKTYLASLLDGDDMTVVLKDMVSNKALESVLSPIFDATIFKGLTSQIFTTIDEAIMQITGVNPETDWRTNLKATKKDVISTLEQLLGGVLDNTDQLELTDVGKILDVLKSNAKNNGTYDGVFNNVFANLIWYLTGVSINDVVYTAQPNTNYEDIKNYLDVTDKLDYYEISYEEKMAEIVDVLDFVDNLSTALDGKDLTTPENKQEYIQAFINTIDTMAQSDDESKINVINNVRQLLDSSGEELLPTDTSEEDKKLIKQAINNQETFSAELKTAVLNLLGL